MGSWIRVDVNRHQHPKARELGAWGCVVVEAVWEICKVYGDGGVMKSCHVSAEQVSEWLRFDREDAPDGINWEQWVNLGLQRCYVSKALIGNNDGTVTVKDWAQRQIDSTAKERKRRERDRKSVDIVEPVTDVTVCHSDISMSRMSRRQDGTEQNRTEGKPPPIKFNYDTGKLSRVFTDAERGQWSTAYPDIDLVAETKKAMAWMMSNPGKRKKDIKAFLNNWFSRAQKDREK